MVKKISPWNPDQRHLKGGVSSGGCLVTPFSGNVEHRLNKHDVLIITEPIIGDQKPSVTLMALPESLPSVIYLIFLERKQLTGWKKFFFPFLSPIWKISEFFSQKLNKEKWSHTTWPLSILTDSLAGGLSISEERRGIFMSPNSFASHLGVHLECSPSQIH